MVRKKAVKSKAMGSGHFHTSRCTTKSNIVVTSIVVVNATPYAAARLLDERSIKTRAMQESINNQLIAGI
jgi:hypothetical protein